MAVRLEPAVSTPSPLNVQVGVLFVLLDTRGGAQTVLLIAA